MRKKDLIQRLAIRRSHYSLDDEFYDNRLRKVEEDGMPVVDVDGSYLYREYKTLSDMMLGEMFSSRPFHLHLYLGGPQ